MHIDITWKFKEMIEFRERKAKELGIEVIVYTNEQAVKQGINPLTTRQPILTACKPRP